jgi:hypothetical protein
VGRAVTAGRRPARRARVEQSSFAQSGIDTTKVRLDVTVTVRLLESRPGRPDREVLSETLPDVSTGWADISAFSDAVAGMHAAAEDDAHLDAGGWADPTGPPPEADPLWPAAPYRPGTPPPVRMLDLYPDDVRDRLQEPDLSAFEAERPRYNVYPELAANLRARTPEAREPGGVVRVTAEEIPEQPYRELVRIQGLARQARVTILADVVDGAGFVRRYRVEPGGGLHSRVTTAGSPTRWAGSGTRCRSWPPGSRAWTCAGSSTPPAGRTARSANGSARS